MLESGLIISGVAAAMAAPVAVSSMQEACERSGVDSNIVSNLVRRIRVTALDKVLRRMMERSGEKYSIFMSSLDAMNDNIIFEALDCGVSVVDIAHVIFSCEESVEYTRSQLNKNMGLGKVNPFLKAFQYGVPLAHTKFAKALIDRMAAKKFIKWNSSKEEEEFDLSDYNQVDKFFVTKGMKCTLYADGVVHSEGFGIISAIVPVRNSILFFLHRDSEDMESNEESIPDIAKCIVEKLTALGCDEILAWRLLSMLSDHNQTPLEYENSIIIGYKIIAQFRTNLLDVLEERCSERSKCLFGDKTDLKVLHNTHGQPNRQELLQEMFSVDKSVFSDAKTRDSPRLRPLTTSVFDKDPLEISMAVLEKFIERAKSSSLNAGKSSERCKFNARTVAVLGAFGGKEVYGGVISNKVKTQYFYQDDEDTKSLVSPFSKLMIFSTTSFIDIPKQSAKQYLLNAEPAIENWIALRAAHEFDPDQGRFRYGTDSFREAEDLVNKSVAEFIQDNDRRFSKAFSSGPKEIYVSQIHNLSKMMSEKTGASSPWLVRELISRYISHGAEISSTGPLRYDCFGNFQENVMIHSPDKSDKKLIFDCKVDMAGIKCEMKASGKVFLLGPSDRKYDAELLRMVQREIANDLRQNLKILDKVDRFLI